MNIVDTDVRKVPRNREMRPYLPSSLFSPLFTLHFHFHHTRTHPYVTRRQQQNNATFRCSGPPFDSGTASLGPRTVSNAMEAGFVLVGHLLILELPL